MFATALESRVLIVVPSGLFVSSSGKRRGPFSGDRPGVRCGSYVAKVSQFKEVTLLCCR